MTKKPSPTCTFTFYPPQGDRLDIVDVCVWLLRVMDRDDRSMGFIASLLQHFLRKGSLTEKQADGLWTVYLRIKVQFSENRLDIQGYVRPDDDQPDKANVVRLSNVKDRRK